eukprot:COSAG06_NODE_15137_length_1047_cov_1.083333_1_plen_277_part_10
MLCGATDEADGVGRGMSYADRAAALLASLDGGGEGGDVDSPAGFSYEDLAASVQSPAVDDDGNRRRRRGDDGGRNRGERTREGADDRDRQRRGDASRSGRGPRGGIASAGSRMAAANSFNNRGSSARRSDERDRRPQQQQRQERPNSAREPDLASRRAQPVAATPRGPCGNYRLDMSAEEFGQCKCGFPKSAHADNVIAAAATSPRSSGGRGELSVEERINQMVLDDEAQERQNSRKAQQPQPQQQQPRRSGLSLNRRAADRGAASPSPKPAAASRY